MNSISGFLKAALPLIVLVVLPSLSCGDPPSPGPPLTVVDSAGIEIVEFDVDQLPVFGTVHPDPDWVFGAGSGSDEGVPLNFVVDARLLSDGRVVVANFQPQEILVTDPETGEWVRIADDGEGPGGVDFISSIAVAGDTIGVYDGVQRQWLEYSEGEYVGARTLTPVGVPGPFFPDAVLPDGEGFYIGDAYAPPGSPGGAWIRRELLVSRVEGGRVDTIAIVPGESGIDKFTGVSALPFGPSYGMAATDSGIWLGDSAFPEVDFWTNDGQLNRIVRWRSGQDRSLTRRRLNGLRDRALEGESREQQVRIRRGFREIPFPDEFPAWITLILGVDGVLWIGEYPEPETDRPVPGDPPAGRWWGIGPQGRPVGTLVTPPGFRVTDFAGDYLVGIHRDSLNVETVRRHEILRAKDGAGSR